MASLGGFTLLETQPPHPGDGRSLWEIVAVEFGHETDWSLRIEMEDGERKIAVAFPTVVSFRAQDESEMLFYWPTRDNEGVAIGTLYAIKHSLYKDEFREGGIASTAAEVTHYLVAGYNLCVEALATEPPSVLIPPLN